MTIAMLITVPANLTNVVTHVDSLFPGSSGVCLLRCTFNDQHDEHFNPLWMTIAMLITVPANVTNAGTHVDSLFSGSSGVCLLRHTFNDQHDEHFNPFG